MCLRILFGNHQRFCITKLLKSLYPNGHPAFQDISPSVSGLGSTALLVCSYRRYGIDALFEPEILLHCECVKFLCFFVWAKKSFSQLSVVADLPLFVSSFIIETDWFVQSICGRHLLFHHRI